MMKNILLFIFFFSVFSSFSQELIQNDAKSSITFTIKNFGFDVNGNFSDFKIQSNFNTDTLKECYLNAYIQVISIFTDSKGRDEHLMKSDYFDAEKHSEIKFKSSEIKKTPDDTYIIKGDLTIKGITKSIETFLELNDTENGVLISANFTINRKDFEVGGNSFVLSKNVTIQMIYVASKN
jgi:polyisoprenoid-binding protein YceI